MRSTLVCCLLWCWCLVCANTLSRYEYSQFPLQEAAKQPEFECPRIDCMEPVDLGLSVQWATCNVGAVTPEDYGDWFSWGETVGYQGGKTDFTWFTYQLRNQATYAMTKYVATADYGTVDGKTTLEPADDAAYVNWGSDWRMPTHDEWLELQQQCTCVPTTQNGVSGCLVTAKNGNSIFLPATGNRDGTNLNNAGVTGYYWTSSLYTTFSNLAQDIYIYPDGVAWNDFNNRYYGFSVRAVYTGTFVPPTDPVDVRDTVVTYDTLRYTPSYTFMEHDFSLLALADIDALVDYVLQVCDYDECTLYRRVLHVLPACPFPVVTVTVQSANPPYGLVRAQLSE